MKQQKGRIRDEGDRNGAGRRQKKEGDAEDARSHLPDDEQTNHDCKGI